MSNIGCPKKERLNKVMKFTISEEEAEIFSNTISGTGKSKSDVLRELVPIISSKDFEGLIPDTKMEILQNYSEKCWDMLHTPGCIFEVNNLSEKMPAFISTIEQPSVYVKYPTYKIQILYHRTPEKHINENEIEALLKNVKNRSLVYSTKADFLVIDNKLTQSIPYVYEVMCLGVTLEDNTHCQKNIVDILNESNYHTSICPAFCIRRMAIELLNNDQYFRVLQN